MNECKSSVSIEDIQMGDYIVPKDLQLDDDGEIEGIPVESITRMSRYYQNVSDFILNTHTTIGELKENMIPSDQASALSAILLPLVSSIVLFNLKQDLPGLHPIDIPLTISIILLLIACYPRPNEGKGKSNTDSQHKSNHRLQESVDKLSITKPLNQSQNYHVTNEDNSDSTTMIES